MSYVIGAVVGLTAGALIGHLKNILIWKGYVNKDDGSQGNESAQVYSRAMISYFVNILVLVIVFFLRNLMPWNWMVCLVAVATGMALMNIVTAAKRK